MNTHDAYLNCSGIPVRKCDECSAQLCNCFVAYGHDCEPSPETSELIDYIKDLEFLERLSPNDPLVQYLPQARADLLRITELLTSSNPNTEGNTAMEIQENTVNEIDPNNITAIDRTVSVTEAAALLEVTGQTIRNWVRSGRLTATKHGKTFRIDAEQLHGLRSATREIRVIDADEHRG
jgi:excisionase family DNA binding protein